MKYEMVLVSLARIRILLNSYGKGHWIPNHCALNFGNGINLTFAQFLIDKVISNINLMISYLFIGESLTDCRLRPTSCKQFTCQTNRMDSTQSASAIVKS